MRFGLCVLIVVSCFSFIGCGKQPDDTSPANTLLRSGIDAPSACKITILNPSRKTPRMVLAVPGDRVLIDGKVSSYLNVEPPVCGVVFAQIAGKTLSISVDGIETKAEINSGTKEIVVDVSKAVTNIQQHGKRLQWR